MTSPKTNPFELMVNWFIKYVVCLGWTLTDRYATTPLERGLGFTLGIGWVIAMLPIILPLSFFVLLPLMFLTFMWDFMYDQ